MSKPWNQTTFEKERPYMTEWVKENLVPLLEVQTPVIVIRAPVKSGKREIAEYTAVRDEGQNCSHAFVSAWHRVADDDQREELSTHNMDVFSITDQKNVDKFIEWLTEKITEHREIKIHLDECDYASGSNQMLSHLWNHVRDAEHITTILYSATPEEVLFAGEIPDETYQTTMDEILSEGYKIEYTPPEGFCGPERFLREGLVHEALPFFDGEPYVLTDQGKTIVTSLVQGMTTHPERNILVLRLTYSIGGKNSKENKAFYRFLSHNFPELSTFLIIADKVDKTIKNKRVLTQRIQWSNEQYWNSLGKDRPILMVIDQTSSRSTEWKCHHRVFATHDFRKELRYSTVSQAQERTNHYEQTYGGFQRIHIYGNVKTHLLSAGQISYEKYLTHDWKKKKINSQKTEERYRVISDTKVLHRECPEEGLTEIDSNRLLQKLGCFGEMCLSSRIMGGIREIPVYKGTWKQVTQSTWNEFWRGYDSSGRKARNPFDAAVSRKLPGGPWLGQHRGWKHLRCIRDELYEVLPDENKKLDLGATGGDRIKVCYHNGDLGVFIVNKVGMRTENTLTAYKSMYGS